MYDTHIKLSPVWGEFKGKEHHRVYSKPGVFSGMLPTTTTPMPHVGYVMLKSFAKELAEKYADLYAFIASHREGRYSSASDSIDDKANSQEEDLGGVWWSMLVKSGKGVYQPLTYGTRWGYGTFSEDAQAPYTKVR